jgi:hypothetical protein
MKKTKTTAKKKPLCPEMARRKVLALEKFLADGDIDLKTYWRLKQRVLAEMLRDE